MKKVIGILAFLSVAVVTTLSTPVMAQFFLMKSSLEGKPAPDFKLLTTMGKEMSLNEARDGKSTILFFWATWCPHCREQLIHLAEIENQLKQKNINVFLVDVGEGPGQVQSFLESKKIPFVTFLDQDSNVSETYELIGVPTFFLINKEGKVKSVVHALPEDYEEVLK